jgi:hypothetical protein
MKQNEEMTWTEAIIDESDVARDNMCPICFGVGFIKEHHEFFNKSLNGTPCPECSGSGLRKDDNEQGNR